MGFVLARAVLPSLLGTATLLEQGPKTQECKGLSTLRGPGTTPAGALSLFVEFLHTCFKKEVRKTISPTGFQHPTISML